MKTRLEIYKKIKLLEKQINIPLTYNIDSQILDIINKQDSGQFVNYFFDLQTQRKLGITALTCFRIEKLIYSAIFEEFKKTAFNQKFANKNIKEDLKNYKLTGFLAELDNFIEIKNLTTNIVLTQILSKSDKKHKIEYKLGRKILLLLYTKCINNNAFADTIKIDKDICKYILLELFRKTPRIFPLAQKFVDCKFFFFNTASTVIDLFIVLCFYYTENKIVDNLWSSAAEELHLPVKDIHKILRKKFLNVVNIYAKIISVECLNIFLDINLIKVDKNNTYTFCDGVEFFVLGVEKLPNLYLESPINRFDIYKFENISDSYSVHQILNDQIQHDFMTSSILDKSFWFKSMGLHRLNLIFINELLKNFLLIKNEIEENKNKKYLSITKDQISFIEQFFDISISSFKKDFLENIIFYCFDFTFKENELEKSEDLQIKNVINKIKNNKYIFLKCLTHISILLRFKHFEYAQKFDARGRAYPDASILNHHHPLFKLFITFDYVFTHHPILEQVAIQLHHAVSEVNISKIFEGLKKNITTGKRRNLLLKEFFGEKKFFQKYLSYMDLINIANKKILFYTGYKLDARSSGLQIITMLLNNNKLAEKIGLTSENTDIYNQFVTFYHSLKKNIQLHKLSLDSSCEPLITYINNIDQKCLENYIQGNFDIEKLSNLLQYFNFKYLRKYFKKTATNEQVLQKYKTLGFFKESLDFYIFINVIELFLERKKTQFDSIVHRQLVKPSLMTWFYGSSLQSRLKNYVDVFLNSELYCKANLPKFKNFAIELDSILRKWLYKFYPEALILIHALRKVCNKKEFNCVSLETAHAKWQYIPLCKDSYSKSILNKDFKLTKYSTEIDFKKLKSSFFANYIQFIDANICSSVVKNFKQLGVPIKTTHDCFECPYIFSNYLRKAIYDAYVDTIKQNYLKIHFEKTNKTFYDLIKSEKIKSGGWEPIKIENIPMDASSLVK